MSFNELVVSQLIKNRNAGLKPTTQTDIAQYLGVSAAYINAVIRGRKKGVQADKWKQKIIEYVGINLSKIK